MVQHGLELADRGVYSEIEDGAARQARAPPVVRDRAAIAREVLDQRRPRIAALGDHLKVGEPRRDHDDGGAGSELTPGQIEPVGGQTTQ
jgi:hypothetical protein